MEMNRGWTGTCTEPVHARLSSDLAPLVQYATGGPRPVRRTGVHDTTGRSTGRTRAARRRPSDAHLAWLELWPTAAALVDDAGRVLAANGAMRSDRVFGGGAAPRTGSQFAPGSVSRAFDAALAAVISTGTDRAFTVPLAAVAGTLELRLRRVPRAVHPHAALVSVHRPDVDRLLCVDRLRELYGLTRTQTNVVQALVATPGLGPVAEALGLSPNTVRAHLKQVFAKCGVRSQPELLQRLALGAARRARDAT
jgi:hypothetical protein